MLYGWYGPPIIARDRLVAIKREPELQLTRNTVDRERQLMRLHTRDLNRQRTRREFLIDRCCSPP